MFIFISQFQIHLLEQTEETLWKSSFKRMQVWIFWTMLDEHRSIFRSFTVSFLCSNFTKWNQKFHTKILHFIFAGQRDIIEYLIEHGAEVSPNITEWEQLALGCALRGIFVFFFKFSTQFQINNNKCKL